eukprot:4975769-Pyramimonas_sp.AAC.2
MLPVAVENAHVYISRKLPALTCVCLYRQQTSFASLRLSLAARSVLGYQESPGQTVHSSVRKQCKRTGCVSAWRVSPRTQLLYVLEN